VGWKEEGKGKEGEARKGEAEGEGRVSGGVGRSREDEGGMQGKNFCPSLRHNSCLGHWVFRYFVFTFWIHVSIISDSIAWFDRTPYKLTYVLNYFHHRDQLIKRSNRHPTAANILNLPFS